MLSLECMEWNVLNTFVISWFSEKCHKHLSPCMSTSWSAPAGPISLSWKSHLEMVPVSHLLWLLQHTQPSGLTPCIAVSLYTDVYREVTRSVLSMLHHLVLNTDMTPSLLICNSSAAVIGQYQYVWPKDNWNILSFHSANL